MKLQKQLGWLEVFAICAGAMVSSGLFVLPGLAFALAGPSMFLAYLLAGLLTIPALVGKAELATAMPKAGGIYFYVDRSMGRAMGTLGGLAGWFSLTLKSAFALVGIGAFTALLFPELTEMHLRMVSAGFCILFTIVNLISVHHAGRLQTYMVFGLLVILLVYAVAGLGAVEQRRLVPFMPEGWGGLLATTGLVFVSFGGLTKAASVAEEVRNPGRNLPLGMFLAFFVVLALYTVVTFVTVGIVAPESLANTLTPINLGAAPTLGKVGVIAVTVAAVLAFVSTANAGIMAASRMPLAMSRDRLLPKVFEKIHEGRGTPNAAIIATGGFMTAVILFLDLEALVKTASTLKLLLFVLVNVAVILMRESRIQSYRPVFRSPLYPWMQVFGIASYLALIAAMGALPLALASGFVVLSLAWYHWYGRRGATGARDSAAFHIVKRIAGQDLSDQSLGSELRDILRERDGIQEDRFDRLVSTCEILEVEGKPSLESFLHSASGNLAEEVGLPEDELVELILERERDTSTVITPHLAIPHAVVPGSGRFHLLVARCEQGVTFSETAGDVNAIFLLVGSLDERNFHLRALMAIAEIAQEPGFHDRWQQANTTEDIRDLMLLSNRRRQSDD